MENIAVLNSPDVMRSHVKSTITQSEISSRRKSGFNPAIVKVIAEGGENFFLYLKSINLSKEPELLVLSSTHHYYYDANELKDVRALVNLKKLNQVKHLERFLKDMFSIIPSNAGFVGCFSDDKPSKKIGFSYCKPSRLSSRFLNFIDSRTDHLLDRNEVTYLLKKYGYNVIDMTEKDGITYFYSQRERQSLELIA
jgi:hypothetical protein